MEKHEQHQNFQMTSYSSSVGENLLKYYIKRPFWGFLVSWLFKAERKTANEEWSVDHTHLYKRWHCGCWCSPPSCGSRLPCPAAAGHRRRPDVHLTRGQTSSSSSAARWCLIRWQQLETGSIYLFFCCCFVRSNYFLELYILIKYYIFNYIIK